MCKTKQKRICAIVNLSVTCVSVGAIQAGKLNVVLPGICPVYTVINEVQGKSIGPGDLVLYDGTSVGAVHPDSPNVGVVTPVRPIQVPMQKGMNIMFQLHVFIKNIN